MKKQMIALGMLMTLLTACGGSGGGGSGGSGDTFSPKIIKPAQVKCGSKDCVTGSTVNTLSAKVMSQGLINAMSADGDSAYSTIKTQYSTTQILVNNTNQVINTLNDMAYDNDIASCESIPTSGSFTFAGWNINLMAGSGSWNIGDGSVVPDHALKMTNSSGDSAYIAFKCGSPQNIHVITEASNGDLYEVFYRVDTATNALKLQYGSVISAMNNYGYFVNNGSTSFTWALFQNTTTNTSPNGFMAGSVGGSYLEFASTYVVNEDIDSVSFGGNTLHYRSCVANYLNGGSATSDSACGVSLSASGLPGNLIGNASTWTTADVAGLSITRPQDM
ncbi:MAG: hypothetical protein KF802_02235 [Bdellovibrionaceae bacterium]|nr:hypothetical protein [Pseudobdellovibrionaceae bacterium]